MRARMVQASIAAAVLSLLLPLTGSTAAATGAGLASQPYVTAAATPDGALAGLVPLFSGDQVLAAPTDTPPSRGVTGWSALVRTAAPTRLSDYRSWLLSTGWKITVDRKTKLTARKDGQWLAMSVKALPGTYPYPGYLVGVWFADARAATP